MQAQDEGGSIIMISSVSGVRPSPGTAVYGASKAGLNHLTRCLAVVNRKKCLMDMAWTKFYAEQAAQERDRQDEQAMYNDLRHGG